MGRSLSPIVKRELENLDKDTSRRAAMTALNSFVKDLDFKAIPLFIAEVSRKKEAGSLSEESSVSLYEGLVRVHGSKLIPLIDTIMDSIIKTMGSVPGSSFALQQACSKVVTAIARYSIDPNVPEDTKRHVIHSLCGPLLDSLLGSQESLTSGAALCLKALVENDNWRFASYEMVNKVCQSVTGALEESSTQSNAHMGLVQAMAKRNAVAVEPYARLLIRAGFKILDGESEKANSQKRLSTIQMIKFLIKSLDIWCIQGEIGSVIEEMEKCQSDPMAFVRVAALETLRTARSMVEGKGSKLENGCPGSVTGSNFSRRFLPGSGDQSPASAVSPLSRTFNSLVEYDSLIGSPILSTQDIQYLDNDSRSVDRKFLGRENGGGFVDVSLKDGLFSGSPRSNGVSNGFLERSDSPKIVQSGENHEEEFLGFSRTKLTKRGISRSATSSPVRSRTPIRIENDIYRTPRSHVYSLQDPLNLASTERPPRWSRNQLLSDFERSPVFRCEHRNCDGYELRNTRSLQDDDDKFHGSNESVSSMEEIPVVNGDIQEPEEVLPKRKAFTMRFPAKLVCGLSLALLAVAAPIWLTSQEQGYYLVPT